MKPLKSLEKYLQIKKSLELLAQNKLDSFLSVVEDENFWVKSSNNIINLSRPPSLYLNNRISYKTNNYEFAPFFLEMHELKYGLLISQELSYFLQHKFPQKAEYNFKFSDFLLHFLEIFNNIANASKGRKFCKNEIQISAEKLMDLPDIIKGDCERLDEILGFLFLPIIKKCEDLVKITITCDTMPPKNEEIEKTGCFFFFIIEILRKTDDEDLERFLKSQIFAYANKNQQEIYDRLLKTLQNDDFFLIGLNLLPFILKILDNEYFDISGSGFLTTIKFALPFALEPTDIVKSPCNYLKYNVINLNMMFHIVTSKKKKSNENEYLVFSLEKKSLRSFEEFGFIEKNRFLEPSSSESIKGSAKSSPLKKNRNHKVLREDLLKMVSPETSYHSTSDHAKEKDAKRKQSLPLPSSLPNIRKEAKICLRVFEFERVYEKKEGFKNSANGINLNVKTLGNPEKQPINLKEILSNHIDNYMDFLQEKYRETLEKTIMECLKIRTDINLTEIHEELFNLISEDNKFKFLNQKKDKEKEKETLFIHNRSPQNMKKKTISNPLFFRKDDYHKVMEKNDELPPPPPLLITQSERMELNPYETKIHEQGSTIIHDNEEISSITDNKLENQLEEMLQGYENHTSSLKMDEMEEIKEEMELEFFKLNSSSTNSNFLRPGSNRESPYSKTIHQTLNKSKFDKGLISPISRPLNILKIRTKS